MCIRDRRRKGVNDRFVVEDAGLLCSDAVLPGSALASVDSRGDYQGVIERFAHTRNFTQIQLEFYVDNEYKSMKFFTTFIFSKIDLFLAQSKETINRLNILGASNTKLLGNMKINPENYSTDEKKKQKYAKILATDVLNIVLGSSHNGEEEFVIDALEGLNINLILAPRHPERINKVLQIVESKGYKPIKVSDVENYGQIKQIDGKTLSLIHI